MKISVVTLFPELFSVVSAYGITGRAVSSGILSLDYWNPRDFCSDRHRTVDDKPYGGGPGMVMMVEPMRKAIYKAKQQYLNNKKPVKVIHLSPQGKVLTQTILKQMTKESALILVASRYEGVDERLIAADIDEEYSIGDYVISGGEIAAMVLIDGVTRLLPNALGDSESAELDSFMHGLLDYPHYTRPGQVEDMRVPDVLLSGDHQAIARWRKKQSLGRTWLRRPDLLQVIQLDSEQSQLLSEFIQEYEQEFEKRV